MIRPTQRAGHIGTDDNRFCGASVFGELAATTASVSDLIARAFGLHALRDGDREVVRCIALALTSPDARVWPLKMTRTLAAYGNPFAGFYGAQLGNFSDRMGPGTTANAAASLAWIHARVGGAPSAEAVAAAVREHLASRGRVSGFGVPFRRDDERLLALRRMLDGHVATRRPHWRLSVLVADAMREAEGLEPNVVIAVAALLLDLGLSAHRAGMFTSVMMSHNFAAHALEASEQDGPYLRELPERAIEDCSAPPRRTAAAAASGGSAQIAPRRSLAW
jgi:hypothetical protein